MSILRIIKNKSVSQKARPLAALPDEGLNDMPRYVASREYYPYFWGTVLLFAVALISLAGGAYWVLEVAPRQKAKLSVYVDLKAVDEAGHPIAGAQVFNRQKQLGVTDSFGEWRKFLLAPAGSTVSIRLHKKTSRNALTALKNFAVPMDAPSKGEVVLGGAVTLLAASAQPTPASSTEPTAAPSAGSAATAVAGSRAADEGKRTLGLGEKVSADEEEAYGRIAFRVMPNAAGGPGTAGRQALLQRHVVAALQRESQRLGLKLDSAARHHVSLFHIPYPDGGSAFPGVIRVVASRLHSSDKIDFLVNYTGQATSTARAILQGLASHQGRRFNAFVRDGVWLVHEPRGGLLPLVPGSYLMSPQAALLRVSEKKQRGLWQVVGVPEQTSICPSGERNCVVTAPHLPQNPPNAGWTANKMRLYGVTPAQVDVYVAGYKALHEGEQIWKYWARPGQQASLSVIKQGLLAFRKSITAGQSASQFTTVPSPALSRQASKIPKQ